MREFFFILLVIFVLLALTAVRYRKQIAGMIGLAKMLKEAKDAATGGNSLRGEKGSVHLVNCASCGVWVPQNKAIEKRSGFYYCSNECSRAAVSS